MAKKDNKDKFVEAAQKFIQKQQFDKAIKEYEKAFEADKKDARISLKLGELYQKIKKPQDGLKYFRQAAINYGKDGFYPKAVAVYKQILAFDDSNLEIRLEIADLYFKLALMSDAISNYRTVLEKYEKEGNNEKVLEIIRKMVEIEPNNANTRVKLAEFYFKGGQREQGYTEFRRAAEELRKAQRWEDLVKLFEKLTKADPANPDNYHGYGDALMERGELEKAFHAYYQLLKYRPEDTEAMDKLVTVSIRLKDTQNAVYYLKKLASIAENKGDKTAAKAYLQRVLKYHPADEDVKAKLGPDKAAPQKAAPPPLKPAQPQKAAPPPQAPAPALELEPEDDEKIEALPEADEETPSAPEPEPADVVVESSLIQPTEEELKPPTEDQVPGMLTEADVYLKYGLIDKAQQYIVRILSAFPDNHEAIRIGALIEKENGKLKQAVQGLIKAAQVARKNNAVNDARNYIEEALGLDPANTQAQGLMAEFDTGVEISIGIEDEEPARAKQAAPGPALDADVLTIEGEQPEETMTLADDQMQAAASNLEIEEETPFSFVEERGDEQLMLADDDVAPAPAPKAAARKPAPKKAASEPVLELEGEEQTLSVEPEAPIMQIEEETPLELGAEPPLSVAKDEPLLEVEEEALEEIVEQKPAAKPVAAPPPKAAAPPPAEKMPPPAPPPQPKAAPAAPQATPAPPKRVVLARIQLDMEEADFYISQGLVNEARKIYEKILATLPDHAPALQKLKDLDGAAAAAKPSAPIFEEVEEEVEVEEEFEETPTVESAMDAAEQALGDTFREEEKPAAIVEAAPPETVEPVAAEPPIVEQEAQEVSVEEEEISVEALDEIALESQPPESPTEPEALEEAEPEREILAESFEEIPEEKEIPALAAAIEEETLPEPPVTEEEPLAAKEAVTDTIEEPVKPAAKSLDLEDEWDEEAPAKEAPRQEVQQSGSSSIEDAADEAWGQALEPEREEAPPPPTVAQVHPEIDGVAEAADEAFGAAFGEDAQGEKGFDLSSVLDEKEAEETAKAASQEAEGGGADDIGAIIQTFREHVHSQIGQDAGAHFDLGIAYKEMGLLDEAINSFRTALKAGANACQCLHMIGLCFVDQGELNKAESVFREGLTEKNLGEHENMTLKYELAVVIEELGRFNDAIEIFREVAKVNEHFRDVDLAIIRIEERLGPRPPSGPPSKKISYI